jgi:circadian clock protein KaiC
MSDQSPAQLLKKVSSGIAGFDDLTLGGLPAGRTTLLMGGPGCGKTVFALQMLVNGASQRDTPGIFVAFEENARTVSANAKTFGWDMPKLEEKLVSFVDASLRSDVVKAGAFDLTGLLAALEEKVRMMGAKVIVFDAIDVLLSLLNDPAAECRELYRIHEWLARLGVTGIITTKIEGERPGTAQRYGFMPFMADCAVLLTQRVTDRVTVRSIRILKYRGSAHVLNEVPFTIGATGVEVGSSNGIHPEPQPFKDRVSTGVAGLDTMLGGGFYRGTNILITGSSGGGKTTLAGAFIEAACRRREAALFISFDENSRDIVRDLATVNLDLSPHLASGVLHMEAIRTEAASSEEHFMRIQRIITARQPRCVTIDPLSALARVGGGLAARAVAERLIYLCRNAGITVLFTSLIEGSDPQLETTNLHVSTIADSWIQISYSLLDGERNRALSIIKSRGSKHSNQLRELVFSNNGIALAEPYTAGGQVLMGTLRQERESAVNLENQRQRAAIEHQRRAGEEPTEEHDGHGRTGELETLNQTGNSVATKARPKANPPGKLPSNATKGKGKTA